MNKRDEQFLKCYEKYRLKDQEDYYNARIEEYESARNQVINYVGLCMFLAAVFSLLSTLNYWPLSLEIVKKIFGGLAVVIPALSAAFAAYNTLYAFEKQGKLYEDALTALKRAYSESPRLREGLSQAGFRRKLRRYIYKAENVLRSEINQWGQLISEVKPIEPKEISGPKNVPSPEKQEG
ncbi:MAG: hypothetical protein ACUVV0_14345 [Anaerolineae bacterium]